MILSYLALAQAIALVFCAGIGLVLDRTTRVNLVYAILAAASAFWSFCYIFIYRTPDPSTALWWYRLSSFGWCPAILLLFVFALLITQQSGLFPRWLLVPASCYIASLVIIQQFDTLFVTGFLQTPWGTAEIVSLSKPQFWYFVVPVVGLTAACAMLYAWAYRNDSVRRVRVQASFILILVGVTYPIGIGLNVLLPAVTGAAFPAMGLFAQGVFLFGALGLMYRYRPTTLSQIQVSVIEALNDRVILLSSDGRVVKINQFSSPAHEAMVGEKISGLFADGITFQAALDLAIRDRHTVNIRAEWLAQKGSTAVQVSIRAVFNSLDDVEGFVLIIKTLPDFDLVADQYGLSSQERLLVRHSLQGLALKEIGSAMNLSTGTIKNYLANVYRKTDTHSQVDLVRHFYSQL